MNEENYSIRWQDSHGDAPGHKPAHVAHGEKCATEALRALVQAGRELIINLQDADETHDESGEEFADIKAFRAALDQAARALKAGAKTALLVLLMAFSGIGCRGVNRLIDGPESAPPPPPKVIVGGLAPLAKDAPNFDVPVPAGTVKVVYYGELPLDGVVKITVNPNAPIDVFMEERSINSWFKLKLDYSDAFYYAYDAATGTVRYLGPHLDSKAFCIYQYVPAVQP